jgi:hypothetical protein
MESGALRQRCEVGFLNEEQHTMDAHLRDYLRAHLSAHLRSDLRIAAPGPAHPSHPIPPIKPPEPINDPNPIPVPDDDPDNDPNPHQPIIDPNRGVKQPPPAYAAMQTR